MSQIIAFTGFKQTSKCYEQIHDFVVEQKKKAHQAGRDEAVEKATKIAFGTDLRGGTICLY